VIETKPVQKLHGGPRPGLAEMDGAAGRRADIDGCKRIGAHELHFGPTFMPGAQTLDRWLELMEEWRKPV
jgi:hypothetical protein